MAAAMAPGKKISCAFKFLRSNLALWDESLMCNRPSLAPMTTGALEAEETAMLATIQPHIRKERVNNESQNKH
jgi:hypothetical protein